MALGVGFVTVRKPGTLFPGPTINVRAGADHRGQQHLPRMQQRVPTARDRVLLVDDWAERGSQARAPGDGRSVLGQVLRALTARSRCASPGSSSRGWRNLADA